MSPFNHSNRRHNRLLQLLPGSEYQSLAPALERVSWSQGHEVYRQNGPLAHVYFPLSGVCSVVTVSDSGRVVEAATVGNEGMIGKTALLGLDFSPVTATAQVAGDGLRLAVPLLAQVLRSCIFLERLLRRWIAFSLRSAYQTVTCNALHSVEERMCRWLLLTQDRLGGEEFPLTQESLAEMLGVRRQTVTSIAVALQTAGFIAYRRGVIQVLNRRGLENACCECYGINRTFYDLILRGPQNGQRFAHG